MRACRNCVYQYKNTCHRYPPGLLANQTRVWPTIDPEDACGEHTYDEEMFIPFEEVRKDLDLLDGPPRWMGIMVLIMLGLAMYGVWRALV